MREKKCLNYMHDTIQKLIITARFCSLNPLSIKNIVKTIFSCHIIENNESLTTRKVNSVVSHEPINCNR